MRNFPLFRSFFVCLIGVLLQGNLFSSNLFPATLEASNTATIVATNAAPPACNTPTWPVTSNITMSAATFSWDYISGAQTYSVQTRVPNGTWYNVPGSPFVNTSATVDWFLPATTYEWRVRSNCGGGESSYWTYPVTFTTLGWDPCNAPSWLYTNSITQTSATLDWEPVAGAISYNLQYRIWGGSWNDVYGGPWSQTWHTITNLQPNTTYEWRVQTNCSNWMQSTWSYPAVFTTLGETCSPPTWPMTVNITQNSAKFTWEGVPEAHSYTVQIRLWNGTWYNLPGGDVYGTWVTASGLYPGTTYEWRVRTNCYGGGYSCWTYPVTFTTLWGSYCDAPSWLYASNITHNSATLGWDAVPGAYSYSVQYRPSGGAWQDLNGGSVTNDWVNIWGLEPGTSYEWRVRTNCSNWTYSSWSYTSWFTTLGYSCSTPSWLSTTNVTESTADFHWSTVWGAWSYSVQIRQPNGMWVDVQGSPFLTNTAWVSGLIPGTTYQWRVRTDCEDGQHSYWSYAVSFTTSGVASCNAPQWLYTTNITENSANLSWTSVYGALNYTVEWRIAGGTWYELYGGPFSNTWHTISSLLPGTNYEWRVRSNCYFGSYSPWSYVASFTTHGSSCAVPSGMVTSNITDTTATLRWNAVAGALSYGVQTRVPGGTWYDVIGSPFVDTTVVIDELIPGATYEWRVRSKCGAGVFSYWSNAVTFTTSGSTLGGSDDCAGATLLTVNSSCINSASSNVGATQSSPEPMGWCPENNYKDVWFKFTMPDVSNPVVTIRTTAGTLFDGIMEVYRGGDCSSLEYIYCEDDNTTNNGSLMPVISITGTANETIWVRVWGYAGTTGTFNICVFNYQSNDFATQDSNVDPVAGKPLDQLSVEQPMLEDLSVSSTLRIAPNPTSDMFQVSYLQSEASVVSRMVLMDMSGKILYRKDYQPAPIHEFTDQVNVSSLAPGIYVLRVVTTSGILSEKISVVD